MFAVIANRARAIALDFGKPIIRPPDDTDILLIGAAGTAFHRGIQLGKKCAFTGDFALLHQTCIVVLFAAFIKTCATFLDDVGAEKFFFVRHNGRNKFVITDYCTIVGTTMAV